MTPTIPARVVSTKYGNITHYVCDYYFTEYLDDRLSGWSKIFSPALELESVIEHIKTAKVILDIGAHVGCHSLAYSSINKVGVIHSFELQHMMFNLLRKNIEDNDRKNVQIYNCAIGDKIGMVTVSDTILDGPNEGEKFSYSDNKPYNFGGACVGPGTEEHLMITVDSLGLDACDFIKLDVEGFEYKCFLGAKKTIQKYKPMLLYEDFWKADSNYSTADLLATMGYNSFTRFGDDVLALTA